jgi:hypothetical protein
MAMFTWRHGLSPHVLWRDAGSDRSAVPRPRLGLIEPHDPKVGKARRPYPLEVMLRVYFLLQWCRAALANGLIDEHSEAERDDRIDGVFRRSHRATVRSYQGAGTGGLVYR